MREVRRLRFEPELRGGHVHVAVWAGTGRYDRRPDGTETGEILGGQRARCGDFVMRPEEWESLEEVLRAGIEEVGYVPLCGARSARLERFSTNATCNEPAGHAGSHRIRYAPRFEGVGDVWEEALPPEESRFAPPTPPDVEIDLQIGPAE